MHQATGMGDGVGIRMRKAHCRTRQERCGDRAWGLGGSACTGLCTPVPASLHRALAVPLPKCHEDGLQTPSHLSQCFLFLIWNAWRTCRFDITPISQGNDDVPNRNSMPYHFNSANTSFAQCRIFVRKQWPSLMPCIQTPYCFYFCCFFALGYRSNKFPGKWNSLIRFPSIKFHIRNEKISLNGLNIAVNQYT